jgi:16S rRNA (cytosine1407-C5)-methyltransferase
MVQPNLPEAFTEKLQTFLSPDQAKRCLTGFSASRKPSFRVNTLKTTTNELKEVLTGKGFHLTQISWYPEAFCLENKSIRELTEIAEYKAGFFYIQNLSSMLPSLLLNPQPHEKVLDIAAAPGSKTTHIAMLMQNRGEITANDISYNRLFQLKRNLQEQGVTNTKAICLPGQKIWEQLPNYFDRALVDVPCSMEGRFVTGDPKTFEDWTPKKGKMLAPKQQYLLRSAISATKPGGTIIYSTCTISPEENEGVVDWIVKKEQDAITVEHIHLEGIETLPGITHYGAKKYSDEVKKCLRILPSEITEGFFITKLKRNY